MSRFGAVASQAFAGEVAREVLENRGSAVDAVFGGFFAHAAVDAGVVLAPVVVLVNGGGAGARVFDGRAQQPGRGIARPRGFVDARDVPPAARAAVPRSVATFAVAHARHGRIGASQVVRAGLRRSEVRSALPHRAERVAFLEKIAALGALALHRDDVRDAIVARLGPAEGGLLSVDDLAEAAPTEAAATRRALDGGRVFRAPFAAAGQRTAGVPDAVVAHDAHGQTAILVYDRISWGVVVPEIGALLPAVAEPVLRGAERVKPGTVLGMRVPAAICERSDGYVVGAFVVDGRDLEDEEWAPALAPSLDDGFERAAADSVRAGNPSFRVAGLMAGDGNVRPFGNTTR